MPGGVGSTRMLPLKHLTTRHAGRGGVDKDGATKHCERSGNGEETRTEASKETRTEAR